MAQCRAIILDDDDGVIDENADGENQGEKTDAVERIAHDARGEERQQNRRRNDDGDDNRLTPADGEGDKQHDGDRREAEMEQQVIGLVIGRLAVIARDDDIDIPRDDPALQAFKLIDNAFGD